MKQPNGAVLSYCDNYRYALWRTISEYEGTALYIGINPSTADHTIDDQTVMKWRGFSTRIPDWDIGRFLVGNLFAYRSTDVSQLGKTIDPLGIDNDYWLDKLIKKADVIIPCWGNIAKVPKHLQYRADEVIHKLIDSGKPVLCFGKTNSGCPKHPLMLGYDTKIIPW